MKPIKHHRYSTVMAFGLLVGVLCQDFGSISFGQVNDAPVKPERQDEAETPEKPLAPGETPPSLLIEIPDEPRTIDPASILPPNLSTRVTIRFDEKPLRDIASWIQNELGLNVVIDSRAFADAGVFAGEPITESSKNEPLYLLLDRLKTFQIAYYIEDETLYFTTQEVASQHLTTVPYPIGDLFDAGYQPSAILNACRISPHFLWEDDDGEGGTLVLLGDVLFIRQTDPVHHELAGLFAAFRKHGRRTFAFDPPEHAFIRQKLSQNISIEFDDSPLSTALQQIGQMINVEFRLDRAALANAGISVRIPVSLNVTDRPVHVVLQSLLIKHGLAWVVRDGVIQVTTIEAASELIKAAVFDVRDLCRSKQESIGLMQVLRRQSGGRWEDEDGEGGAIESPKTGVLVVMNTERVLNETLTLLENYRAALRVSKPRETPNVDSQEVVTHYYRMEREMADDLLNYLPELVSPDTWKSRELPDAPGTIRYMTSESGFTSSKGTDGGVASIRVPNAVLIIRHKRIVHDAIRQLIQDIRFGDNHNHPGMFGESGGGIGGIGGGMGGGMGGSSGASFGGGFFAVPAR